MNRTPEPELMDDAAEAQAYAQADFSAVNARFVDRVLEVVGDREKERVIARVIDLGCGPGDIAVDLATRRENWTVFALDGAPVMIERASRKAAEAYARNVVPVLGDACDAADLSGRLGTFDVVMSNSLLHHVADPGAMWESIERLLSPGGVVFLRDLRRPASELAATLLVQAHASSESELLQEEFLRSLHAAYTLSEVRRQLDDAGLQDWTVTEFDDRYLDVVGHSGDL